MGDVFRLLFFNNKKLSVLQRLGADFLPGAKVRRIGTRYQVPGTWYQVPALAMWPFLTRSRESWDFAAPPKRRRGLESRGCQ